MEDETHEKRSYWVRGFFLFFGRIGNGLSVVSTGDSKHTNIVNFDGSSLGA